MDSFMASVSDGSYFLGHASVLARIGGQLWLFDPVEKAECFAGQWAFAPDQERVPAEVLRQVAGVFISHEHEDLVDERVLSRLQCPAYIAVGRPRLRATLERCGLRVVELPHHSRERVAVHVDAYVIPSEHNEIDSSFVVRSNGYALYHGNDNFVPVEAVARARDVMGLVTDAYVPFSFVFWYPACVATMGVVERESELLRRVEANMRLGWEHARALDAENVIPCGGNLAYCGDNEALAQCVPTPEDFATMWHHLSVLPRGRRAEFAGKRAAVRGQRVTPLTREAALRELLRGTRTHVRVASSERSDCVRAWDPELRSDADVPAFVVFTLGPQAWHTWMLGAPFESVLASCDFTVERNPERYDERVWTALRGWR